MNKKIENGIKELQFLESENAKTKEETDNKVSEVVSEILEYRPVFKYIKNANDREEVVLKISNDKEILIKTSSFGYSMTSLLKKYNNEENKWTIAASLKIFFSEEARNSYEYEIIKEGKGSYSDVITLAEETLKNISKIDGLVETILDQSIEELKNLIG